MKKVILLALSLCASLQAGDGCVLVSSDNHELRVPTAVEVACGTPHDRLPLSLRHGQVGNALISLEKCVRGEQSLEQDGSYGAWYLANRLAAGDSVYAGARQAHFTGSNIGILPPRLFSRCPTLKSLVLADNNITYVPVGLLDDLRELEHLDISNNALTHVPTGMCARNKKITHVDVSNNKLTQMSADLLPTKNKVMFFAAANNRIADVPKQFLQKLSAAQTVLLSNNQLKKLSVSGLGALSKIEHLDLTQNCLARGVVKKIQKAFHDKDLADAVCLNDQQAARQGRDDDQAIDVFNVCKKLALHPDYSADDLIHNKCDVNCVGADGKTVFEHMLFNSPPPAMLEKMIACGADLCCIDEQGQSMLHRAASAGVLGEVMYLIQHRPESALIADKNGDTPLMCAVKNRTSTLSSHFSPDPLFLVLCIQLSRYKHVLPRLCNMQ